MEDSKKIHQGTYQYKKPFRFMGKEYSDSRSLAEAFIDNWDIAASVFRRGSMEGFWEEYVQDADKQLTDLSYRYFHWPFRKGWYEYDENPEGIEDALFQKSLHYIEPALNGIPFVRAEDNEAKVYSFEELGDWLLSLAAGGKWEVQWIYDEFDADNMNRTFVLNAAEFKVFSAYVPGTEEAEEKFCTAPNAQKCRFLGELALKLQGKECFWYKNVFYTSMEELAPVVKEQLSKGVDIQLFRDLFDSDEYSAAFDSWSAKVDGGKHQKKLSELKESWHKLKEMLPHNDRVQIKTEYSTCDSLLDQFPLNNTEIEVFLQQKYSAVLEKVVSIQKELLYNKAIQIVIIGVVNSFMQQKDMNQILALESLESYGIAKDKIAVLEPYLEAYKIAKDEIAVLEPYLKIYKTAKDKIAILNPYLENERAYEDGLKHAIAYFDEKQLTPGWNEANREGKILLLASGWHSLPAGEPNQAEALLEKINESWQKDKDPSILVDAGKVLLSVLKKGLSGGWDRTSAEGASAYEQCLELIDCVSGLGIGADSAELAENRNKICELMNTKALEPLEQALSEFSDKYQKDEAAVVSILKSSGWFEGISYDGEKKVTIKLTVTPSKKYEELITEIEWLRRAASLYLSEYKQQIEKLNRELYAIKETGCHYGKLHEDFKEHNRFMKSLKEAEAEEDNKKRYHKEVDLIMEIVQNCMKSIDFEKEYKQEEMHRSSISAKELSKRRRKKSKTQKRKIFFRKHRKPLTVLAVLAAGLVLFYFRYASPTYYGTKFYLGNRINYSEYKIADSVEKIYPQTFEGADRMTHIEIPESVTVIGLSAFAGCTSLKEIIISESVTEIGAFAFAGCTSLQEIVIPESVIEIGGFALADCISLQEIVIPGSVIEIGGSAFMGCTSLESAELHSSTLFMGGSLFQDCGSLKEIRNEGNIADFEELLNGRVSNCCNLDMSDVYDNLYSRSIEGIPLLENEVQLKNLLDRREIPYGEEFSEAFDPALDILTDAEFGAENADDYCRIVNFSFKIKHRGVMYTFKGTASSGSESSEIKVELNCIGIDISEQLQQLSAGDENAILEMVDGRAVPINGLDVTLKKDVITVLESELIEESEEKYSILLKLKINKPLGGITLLGRVQLLEQNTFVPELIFLNGAADIELLGSYTYSPAEDQEPVLTIDKQYEKCYSVTMYGEKKLLIMDDATESKGKLISMTEEGNLAIESMRLSEDMDGIEIGSHVYYKKDFDVSDTMPEDITPFAGVWQGTYQANKSVTVNSRRYILPIKENVLAVVSDFGPMEGAGNFASGTTLDILNYDPQSGSCVIESKEWLEKPEGYVFATFEGNVNDSYDIISGEGRQGPFVITKTEPNNTAGMAVDIGNWSIYDASGNIKKELLIKNIPVDAFTWNGHSYYLYNNFETWEEAEAYCESLGGHLAIIESAEENKAVYSYVTGQGYTEAFFGASDAAEEGKWRWVDGSAMSYTNWHSGEPNSKTEAEDYIMYYYRYTDGTWNDGPDGKLSTDTIFICEWD